MYLCSHRTEGIQDFKNCGELEKNGAMEHTIIVVAGASDPAALHSSFPLCRMCHGEYFLDKGKDVLIIYDDLSKHAWAYRQISLILRRPPGREAYPGDISICISRSFGKISQIERRLWRRVHSQLFQSLKRSRRCVAYIPTNVISITDGRSYLENRLVL